MSTISKFAHVTFDSNPYGKHYVFHNEIEGLEVEDKVVVETAHGLEIATIVDLTEASPVKATKYIVDKIDLTAMEERKAKAERLKEVKAKMVARRKKVEENQIYEILAKDDPEMAVLLAELKSISE